MQDGGVPAEPMALSAKDGGVPANLAAMFAKDAGAPAADPGTF